MPDPLPPEPAPEPACPNCYALALAHENDADIEVQDLYYHRTFHCRVCLARISVYVPVHRYVR